MEFNVGDVVLLQLGVDAKFAPKGLKRWDGCQFVISKVTVRKPSATNRVALYELSSCKSAEGIPYTIMEEWIVRMR